MISAEVIADLELLKKHILAGTANIEKMNWGGSWNREDFRVSDYKIPNAAQTNREFNSAQKIIQKLIALK